MELRQLKYFEAVASTLNFSKASERLNIAQPPLSRQIQQLELELGIQLLDRSTRPMTLTNAGAFFYDQTVRVLDRLTEIQEATRRIGAGGGKWMGIGFVPSSLYSFMPAVVRQFAADNENLDVTLLELTSIQQVDALISGRIDVGFHRLPIPHENVKNQVLMNERLIVAVHADSRLAREKQINLPWLLEEILILYPALPRPSFADQILQHFSRRGYLVRKLHEANGLHTALGLVAAGIGVSIIPESARLLRSGDVVYCQLAETDLVTPLVMSTRTENVPDHVSRFCAAIKDALAQAPPR